MKPVLATCLLLLSAPVLAQEDAAASVVDPTCPPDEQAMGFCTPGVPRDPHARHAVAPTPAPPVAPASARARSGPDFAADALYPPGAMQPSRDAVMAEHGGHTGGMLLIDRLETGFSSRGDTLGWDAQGWYGTDEHRVWLKTDGEAQRGEGLTGGSAQLLYGRPLNPWWTMELGVRQDFGPGKSPTHAVLGIQGLARYWFELDAALFLSTRGDLTAGVNAEYDQRITNKLILQPRAAIEVAFQDVPGLRLGAGPTALELGARLRYEIVPEFAPFVGVQLERKLGLTARFARDDGDVTGGWAFLVGVRAWF